MTHLHTPRQRHFLYDSHHVTLSISLTSHRKLQRDINIIFKFLICYDAMVKVFDYITINTRKETQFRWLKFKLQRNS